jgi:hypothetical protein
MGSCNSLQVLAFRLNKQEPSRIGAVYTGRCAVLFPAHNPANTVIGDWAESLLWPEAPVFGQPRKPERLFRAGLYARVFHQRSADPSDKARHKAAKER